MSLIPKNRLRVQIKPDPKKPIKSTDQLGQNLQVLKCLFIVVNVLRDIINPIL